MKEGPIIDEATRRFTRVTDKQVGTTPNLALLALAGTSAGGATRKDAQLQCVHPIMRKWQQSSSFETHRVKMVGAGGNGHTINGLLGGVVECTFFLLPKLRALGSREHVF
jgi:hypothetical protein